MDVVDCIPAAWTRHAAYKDEDSGGLRNSSRFCGRNPPLPYVLAVARAVVELDRDIFLEQEIISFYRQTRQYGGGVGSRNEINRNVDAFSDISSKYIKSGKMEFRNAFLRCTDYHTSYVK